MPLLTESRGVAKRVAIALSIVAALLVGTAAFVDPEFAARHLSDDGTLLPYTRHWLQIYRGSLLVAGAVVAACAIVSAVRPASVSVWLAKTKRTRLRIGLAVGATVVAIFVAEVAVRAIDSFQPPVRAGHDFESEVRDFMTSVRPQLNSSGFRDDPFDRPRAANERRVLVVGDSFVFGIGTPKRADTYPAALEIALAKFGAFDVFNGGIPGADTARERAAIDGMIRVVDPDVVVVAFFVNDAESEAAKQQFVQQSRIVPLVSDLLLRYSAVWRRLEPALIHVLTRIGAKTSYVDHLRGLYDVPSEAFAEYRSVFAGLVNEARAGNRKTAVVLFPMVEDFATYPLEDVHAVMRRACQELGVPCLDLLDSFRGLRAADLQASIFDHHLNAAGSDRAAHATAEFLRREGLVTTAAPRDH